MRSTMDTERVQGAWEYALEQHGDQRYGEFPYREHLMEVAGLTQVYGKEFGDDATIVAFLHDVVEDTPATLDDIEERYGERIRYAVHLLTDEPGKDRKERKAATYAKIRASREEQGWKKEYGRLARLVKACDRLANCLGNRRTGNQKLLQMYRKEHEVFVDSVFSGPEDWPGLQRVLGKCLSE